MGWEEQHRLFNDFETIILTLEYIEEGTEVRDLFGFG
jgi:hypothetical protein